MKINNKNILLMNMTKKNPPLVDYETQWIHYYLEPQNYLYFKAYTPIENIVTKLETQLNKLYPDLNVKYESSSTSYNFNRLYRNILSDFKGWQVRYRKTGSKKDYGLISEKIGYKSRAPKQSLQQTVLKKTMLWTHELDLLINSVEIKGANSCETIAQRLNIEISKPRYQEFFKRFQVDLDSLSKNLKTINQELLNSDSKNNHVYHIFNKDLEKLHVYYKQLDLFLTKDYTVQVFGISDVLQKNKVNKTAKGWRVEFLKNEK